MDEIHNFQGLQKLLSEINGFFRGDMFIVAKKDCIEITVGSQVLEIDILHVSKMYTRNIFEKHKVPTHIRACIEHARTKKFLHDEKAAMLGKS